MIAGHHVSYPTNCAMCYNTLCCSEKSSIKRHGDSLTTLRAIRCDYDYMCTKLHSGFCLLRSRHQWEYVNAMITYEWYLNGCAWFKYLHVFAYNFLYHFCKIKSIPKIISWHISCIALWGDGVGRGENPCSRFGCLISWLMSTTWPKNKTKCYHWQSFVYSWKTLKKNATWKSTIRKNI